jgi:dTDP-4-dehydrorhamnose reductase
MQQLVLISGAGGQLGEAMTLRLGSRHEVVAMKRADLDLSDSQAVQTAVSSICPDVIMNCAAYTNVDEAELHPIDAFAANAWAVRTLARAAAEINATLVHFSTDFVFDGTLERPYTEDDRPNPRGAYAASKLLGEWFAAEAAPHYVLRVESLFGGPAGKSSVDKILQGLRSDQEVKAFVDRTVSPSFVDDVVDATVSLLERGSPAGVYHCVNSGYTTWAALAREVAGLIDKPQANVREVSMADVPLRAPRPRFAALSNQKLAGEGIVMPTWQDALRRYIATL